MQPALMGHATPIERLHAALVALGLVLAPLGGGPTQAGLLALTLAAILALPLLTRDGPRVVWLVPALWFGLWVVTAVSLAWSPVAQVRALAGAWSLVVVPALLPLTSRRAWWIWPLGIGLAGLLAVQLAMWPGWTAPTIRRMLVLTSGGFHAYTPDAGLWGVAGCAIFGGMAIAHPSSGVRRAAWAITLFAVLVVAVSDSLAVWIAMAAAALIVLARLVLRPSPQGRMLWIGLSAVAIGGAITVPNCVWRQIDHAARDIQSARTAASATEPRPLDTSDGRRIAWWHAGWFLLKERPLAGHGAGSTPMALAQAEASLPSKWGASIPGFITRNPHGVLVRVAIEQGCLGLALLLALGIGGWLAAWRLAGNDPTLVGLPAAWAAVIIFGVAHAVLLEYSTSALVSLLVAIMAIRAPVPCAIAEGD